MAKGQISFLDKVCHVTYQSKGELKKNMHTKFQQPATNFTREKSFYLKSKNFGDLYEGQRIFPVKPEF
jgi:hypothetical protein